MARDCHLVVDRAILEDALGVGFLEVSATNLAGGDVGSNRQHRSVGAVGIVETVDEVGVARTARAGAHGQLTGHLGLGACGKGRGFLVAHVNPVDTAVLRAAGGAHCVHDGVQGVAHHAVDTRDTGLDELCDNLFCQVHNYPLSLAFHGVQRPDGGTLCIPSE